MYQRLADCVVGLAFCGALFAEAPTKGIPASSFDQGDILTGNRYLPAYSAPAKINLHERNNVFFDASFIYWYAAQDGMGLAISGDLRADPDDPAIAILSFNHGAVELNQPFRYDPGFKIGLGYGFNEWELHAEYTWIRQKTSVSSNAPTDRTLGGTDIPVWIISNWYVQAIGSNNIWLSATDVSSSWRVGIDLLDMTAGRPYYQSKMVTLSPYGGIRTAWIRQSLHIRATVPAFAVASFSLRPQPTHSHNHSNSWGVGPVFGATGHCLLGAGFRVQGDGGFALLFTQYTTLLHKEDAALFGLTGLSSDSLTNNDYNCVRPMANLGLGLGWGKYLFSDRYHIDFGVDYDFNVFWNQNMIRTLVEEFALGSITSDDLFLHGLTVTGRFDF